MASSDGSGGGRKVGEVAAAAGLTVRTLHYYEEIRLLVPSGRSDGGHRLYDAHDIERLYRICVLRRLGFSLADIGRALDDPGWSLRAAMARHLDELEQRLATASRLRGRLVELLRTTAGAEPTATADLLDLVEEMTMLDTVMQRRISYLVYADLERAYDFLVGVFGFGAGQLVRDEEGRAIHAEVQAGDGVIWLHRESPQFGLSSPQTAGTATAGTAVIVDDVDAHHRRVAERGATIEHAPVDVPYGYREYSARDLEGGLWSFMQPLG